MQATIVYGENLFGLAKFDCVKILKAKNRETCRRDIYIVFAKNYLQRIETS